MSIDRYGNRIKGENLLVDNVCNMNNITIHDMNNNYYMNNKYRRLQIFTPIIEAHDLSQR